MAPSISSKSFEHSPEEWEVQKGTIKQLYIVEGLTLPKLKSRMEKEHKFSATDAQYKRKFGEWKFQKNIPRQKMEKIIRSKMHRKKKYNKGSVFSFNQQTIEEERLCRAAARREGALARETSETPSLPSDVECATPSPPPEPPQNTQPLLDDQQRDNLVERDMMPGDHFNVSNEEQSADRVETELRLRPWSVYRKSAIPTSPFEIPGLFTFGSSESQSEIMAPPLQKSIRNLSVPSRNVDGSNQVPPAGRSHTVESRALWLVTDTLGATSRGQIPNAAWQTASESGSTRSLDWPSEKSMSIDSRWRALEYLDRDVGPVSMYLSACHHPLHNAVGEHWQLRCIGGVWSDPSMNG
ncbi:Clr5 domain-containing protein [Sphaerosporella brunnea]|uniref:Clr5 domain-containing protein n=1 Tax=Sphaerosporella brunnea TaxID=1250544 RepID=A0A5J5EYN4_9PEZI|nr:Clr5 domain-containing protein [Sphaerosporella brunnea]